MQISQQDTVSEFVSMPTRLQTPCTRTLPSVIKCNHQFIAFYSAKNPWAITKSSRMRNDLMALDHLCTQIPVDVVHLVGRGRE